VANPIEIINQIAELEAAAAEFIRDGPSTGLPGFIRDGYRKRCDQFANLPPWARLLGNGPSGALDRVCTPYWDDNAWDGPEVSPLPFTGGQCDGEIYLVQWTYETGDEEEPETRTVYSKAYGPIGGASEGENSAGAPGAGLTTRGGLNRTGTPYGCGGLFLVTLGASQYRQFVNAGRNPAIVSVSPCGLDNCGNPPQPPPRPGPNPPPDPGPTDGPEPTDDPDNPDGPPIVPLPPYDDPIYGPTPITGPTGPTGPPGGGPTPPPPGDIGDPDDSSDTGEGGDASGNGGEGEILVGIKIDVLDSPPKARQYVEGVFRGACYIYMGVEGNLDQDYGGSMLKDGQFFFAEKDNLTHWLVSANNGYNFRVTPYYREVQE